MKQPNFSPVFASLYTGLCAIARSNGYALTVHGTLNLDFDLVAIPWTDEAVEWTATTLLDKFRLFFLHRREHYEWTTIHPRI